MKKTFKYRLLGNKSTFTKADEWLLLCQRLYNAALQQRITYYRERKATISCYSQINQLPEVRAESPDYQEVGSQVLQDVIERLDRAYKSFFRRVKNGTGKAGLPRFRSRDRYDSFTLKQAGWRLDGKYLTIRNVGRFKLRLSRPVEGDIKTVTVHRELSGKWYVCFSCDKVSGKRLLESDKIIGLDVGITSFLVDSEGNKVDNPQYLKKGLKDLRRKQRRLANCVKGSHRRAKARILVAQAHEKVSNQRNDFLHKTANYYVKNYGTIAIEDLVINNMVRNHCLARSISDSGWGIFYGFLDYKAEEAGRKVIRYPRFKPSSKLCSCCGEINQTLKLSDRKWTCLKCGTIHDRDENAAKNISQAGQVCQELTYENAQSVS